MKRLTIMASNHLTDKINKKDKNNEEVKKRWETIKDFLDYVWKNKESEL